MNDNELHFVLIYVCLVKSAEFTFECLLKFGRMPFIVQIVNGFQLDLTRSNAARPRINDWRREWHRYWWNMMPDTGTDMEYWVKNDNDWLLGQSHNDDIDARMSLVGCGVLLSTVTRSFLISHCLFTVAQVIETSLASCPTGINS